MRCLLGAQTKLAVQLRRPGSIPGVRSQGPRRSLPQSPVLTRQSAAAAPVAPVALPPLQDEVGVGPLGDPQCVGQQHLLGIYPHGPGGRGQWHKGARTLARTPGHTLSRPAVGAAAATAFSRLRPAALGPRQRPSGQPGTTMGSGTRQVASSPRRRTGQALSLAAWPGPQRREQAAGFGRGGVQGQAGAGMGPPGRRALQLPGGDQRSWIPRARAASWEDAPDAASE